MEERPAPTTGAAAAPTERLNETEVRGKHRPAEEARLFGESVLNNEGIDLDKGFGFMCEIVIGNCLPSQQVILSEIAVM